MTLHELVNSPAVRGALSGLGTAMVIDYHAFKASGSFTNWKSLAGYDWNTATFRWFLGAVAGALAGMGVGAL